MASSQRQRQALLRERITLGIKGRRRPSCSSEGSLPPEENKIYTVVVGEGGARARDGNPAFTSIEVTLPRSATGDTSSGEGTLAEIS